MSDYTPTTEEIIRSFSIPPHRIVERREDELFSGYLARMSVEGHGYQMESEAAARRWLAAHDAEVRAAAEERAEYWENEYRTAEDMKAELRAALAERTGQDATAEARYPMPERDDYETQTDWVTAVVMVQGKRQGWIDHGAALAEQGAEEWEYGYELIESDTRDVLTRSGAYDNEAAARHWAHVRRQDESDPEYPPLDILIVRRRKAGPWVPVDQPASTPGVETRTPNRPNRSEETR